MNGTSAKRSRTKSSCRHLGASLLGMLSLVTRAAPADLDKRWVYLATNPTEAARVDEAISVIRRAAGAGYNGVVVAGWDRPGATEAAYGSGVERMRKTAKEVGVEIVPALFPIGDSRGLLAQDPNLAEAVPVLDALFVVRKGVARLEPDPPIQMGVGIAERLREVGREAVSDHLSRTVRVTPFRQYHVRIQVKTDALDGGAKIVALAGRRALIFNEPDIQSSQDWAEAHAVFNSLDNHEVEV